MNLFNIRFVFIFFLTQSTFAFDRGIIREIGEINRNGLIDTKKNCIQNLVTSYVMANSVNNPDSSDCAIALCNTPENNPSAWITDENFSNSIPKELRLKGDKLSPSIEKIYEKTKSNNLNELKILESSLTSESLFKIEPKKFTASFRDDINALIFKPYLIEILDNSKPLQERLKIVVKLPSNASAEFKKSISEYAESYKKFSMNDYLSFLDKNIYKKEELYEYAKSQQLAAESFIKLNKKFMNAIMFEYAQKDLARAKEILDSSGPDTFDSFKFFTSLDNATASHSSIVPEINNFSPVAECLSEECRISYVEFIKNQNIEKSLEKLKSTISDPQSKTRFINRCKANVISKAMTEANRVRAKKLFGEAKSAIIKNVLPRFSEHSRKILLNYLNKNLNFKAEKPMSKVDPTGIFDKFNSDTKSFLSNKDDRFEESLESSIKRSIIMNSKLSNIDPLSDGASPCASDLLATAWDSFLPVKSLKENVNYSDALKNFENKDHVFISDFSCTHEHRGKHAVAHEIGHALNSVFAREHLSIESAKLYKQFRGCATENYIEAQADSTMFKQEGDSIYTEEDTADLFAFMAFPNDKDLFTCSLLKPNYTNQGYTELDLVLNDGDSHSTSFARVLLEAINKNLELPVSCQRMISKEKPKMSLKKCI